MLALYAVTSELGDMSASAASSVTSTAATLTSAKFDPAGQTSNSDASATEEASLSAALSEVEVGVLVCCATVETEACASMDEASEASVSVCCATVEAAGGVSTDVAFELVCAPQSLVTGFCAAEAVGCASEVVCTAASLRGVRGEVAGTRT